eukprot:2752016-Rhodomonas_salina.1
MRWSRSVTATPHSKQQTSPRRNQRQTAAFSLRFGPGTWRLAFDFAAALTARTVAFQILIDLGKTMERMLTMDEVRYLLPLSPTPYLLPPVPYPSATPYAYLLRPAYPCPVLTQPTLLPGRVF